MPNYVALLRGINVGGHHKIKMDELKECLSALGFTEVQSLLASGNLLFQSPSTDQVKLTKIIETTLEEKFGYPIGVLLRSSEDIQALVDRDPYKTVELTPQTQFYISFLKEIPTTDFTAPYISPDGDFQIIEVTDREIISVLEVREPGKTPQAMNTLEKEFGRSITTRNWNTVKKIATYF